MKLILLAMFIFMSSSSASVVNCDDFFCDGENINFDTITKTLDINLTEDTTKTINNISTGEPLDLIIESNDSSGENQFNSLELNVNGTTNNANFSSAYHVLLSEIMGDINAVFNGRSGAQGKNSSQVYAEEFMFGTYGEDARLFYESRRVSNSSLPLNQCQSEDILFLESRFSCNEGEVFSESSIIDVQRTAERRMCSGTFRRSVCLKRKVDFNCRALIAGDQCCTSTSVAFDSTGSNYILPFSEWSCDVALCQSVDGKAYSGSYIETSLALWEHEIQEGDRDLQCKELFELNYGVEIPINLSWQTAPNNPNSVIELRDASSNLSRDEIYFQIPPITVVGGSNFRIGIESSDISITDCLGLNGSSPDDTFCTKSEKSHEGEITIYVVSPTGSKSNSVSVNIQGNRPSYYRTWVPTVTYQGASSQGAAHCSTNGSVPVFDFSRTGHFPNNREYRAGRDNFNREILMKPAVAAYNCYPSGVDTASSCEDSYYPSTYEGFFKPLAGSYFGSSNCQQHDSANNATPCPTYSNRSICLNDQANLKAVSNRSIWGQIPSSSFCREVKGYPVVNGQGIQNARSNRDSSPGTTTVWNMTSCTLQGFL